MSVLDKVRRWIDGETAETVLEQAARDAFAHDFIMRMANGYDTIVGERGASLSGGQRQRIALARAILRDAQLVILDEPTADRDPAAAEAVGEAVERLLAGRTVLLVTHRPELEARADRVVRLGAEEVPV